MWLVCWAISIQHKFIYETIFLEKMSVREKDQYLLIHMDAMAIFFLGHMTIFLT